MDRGLCLAATAVVAVVGLVLFVVSWDSLEPTQYGLVYNTLTGYVDTAHVYTGGRHIIGPGRKFIEFPANNVRLEFSPYSTANAPPIDARTGRDINDADSGGQPIKLVVSFLYRIPATSVGMLYKSFSTQSENRFMQYARQVLSDVSQRYEPTAFWQHRTQIAEDMEDALNTYMQQEARVSISSLQLLRVDFSSKFEDSIVSIQLATQLTTTKEYQKQVTRVLKETDILESQTSARITIVGAQAAAKALLIMNNATASIYSLTQDVKATSYHTFAKTLNMTTEELVQYIQIKTIRGHNPLATTLGISNPLTPPKTLSNP